MYVETSVISYLTAAPSRDLVVAAHQQVTRDWWSRRQRFELLVSNAVLDEAKRGTKRQPLAASPRSTEYSSYPRHLPHRRSREIFSVRR